MVPLRRVLAKDHFRLYGGTVPCTVSEKIKAKVSIYNRRNPDETPHAKKTQSPELTIYRSKVTEGSLCWHDA